MNQRKPYLTDISTPQWAILEPLISAPKTGGRPRTVDMRERVRVQIQKEKTPSAAIVDSQSVKTTEIATKVGYDGGKLIKGHKRHILVDTLGLLLVVIVTAANLAEKKGAIHLLEQIKDKFPRLEKVFADSGYQGQNFHQRVQEDYNLDLEVVKRNQTKGFKVLPWGWIVERTFALVDALSAVDYRL